VSERAFVVTNASAAPAEALRDAFNASFAGYLVRFPTFDVPGWQGLVRRQGCDLTLSFAALQGDAVAAFALITPRPLQRTRVAVMGARPEARGTGIAARLLDEAIAAATARGDRWIELEVFAQNERAVRLYRSRGMAPVDALYGYGAQPGCGLARDGEVVAASRDDAAQWAGAFDRDHPAFLPWQVGGEAVLRLPGDVQAWRIGGAQMVFQQGETALSVTSLIDRAAAQPDALRLLAALRHRYPEHTLAAPQLHREHGAGHAFEEAGWVRQELHQLLLRRTLAG
jgi:ribosomal protein S18 acetylase RimI-like enzyme